MKIRSNSAKYKKTMEISCKPRALLQAVEDFDACDVLYKENNCSIRKY